jgi:hypothetical protein
VAVPDREATRIKGWVEQRLISLEGEAISPIIREYDDRPRAHAPNASRTSFSLEEGGRIMRRLVLNDGTNLGVVVPNLKRCGCDDRITSPIDTRVL